MVASD